MPSHAPYNSPPKSEPSPDSAGGMAKSLSASLSPDGHSGKGANRKRKSSTDDEDEDEEDEFGNHQPVKKTAHNMIEKRYRTNLNDKIAALRDSVPSLRIMSKSARGEDTTEDREELQGLTPAHKLNKATVLSKATEYIRHLEKRNARLLEENMAMQQRISAFEKLFMAGAMNGNISPMQHQQPPLTPVQYPQETNGFVVSPSRTPAPSHQDTQGMIPVPDDMKRIIAAQIAAGHPYPVPQQQYRPNPTVMRQQQIQQQQHQQMQMGGWQNAGPYFGKLMVGSLAGLMLMEAVRENEQSNETPEGRGLFALPIHLLRFLTSSLNIDFMGYHVAGSSILHAIKVALLLCCVWWAVMPSILAPKSAKASSGKQRQTSLEAVKLASPIHVRRQAWLTAIQTVWVPRHNFFLEATALGLKTVKLSLRNLVGIHGYKMLTGLTQDQEVARVQAWSIALDAQLAGGDDEISKGRLTLTLLASGTLPSTPLRLMLKALHIRVLLWEIGLSGVHIGFVDTIAIKLARAQWNKAKQLHRMIVQMRRNGQESPEEELPDHLAALLEQDCDDVLNPTIIQRAHNLAWNRPTEHEAIGVTDGMDTIVEDIAVRSPMEAIAAWWSTVTLHGALADVLLETGEGASEKTIVVEDAISLAIRTAPIGSVAANRALVARALLFKEKRSANIVAALQAIGPVTPSLLNSGVIEPTKDSDALDKELSALSVMSAELRVSLSCAMAIAHLEKFTPPNEPTRFMYDLIRQIRMNTEHMGMLGCIAAYELMERLSGHETAAEACASTLESLAGTLRIWAGKATSLETDIKHEIVERCLIVSRRLVGIESDTDTGYGSMSEGDEVDAVTSHGELSNTSQVAEISS
ncbi:uncharacterized protein B0I36DRAFT_371026 [Microdochium trichocladiopsis]|uniref:BHLH domain-containing protein n=1 Tax=Microdochium trichocladiopsis TaxID=1682393 RepID=A0A9P9BZM5_9PEZI|nr:uncharacterized protein B0I36DRAFT_371026 [Microdochium trichocladiopsis]KAH7040274.1 hypothetical protein B0I36DRAFT_371026 [Microdochium trichocladiopsis]